MRIITINTTPYHEENLRIITGLTNKEILIVLQPIIDEERKKGNEYFNEILIHSLIEAYPDRIIQELENEYLKL